jgi:uncharacterized repeat protein (TIGR03806 family)
VRAVGLTLLLIVCASCTPSTTVQTFTPDRYPERLSEWGVVTRVGDRLVLGYGVDTYALNTALFSDHAQKLRTLWLPPGTHARYHATDTFDYPVGTVVTKTFFYPALDDVVAPNLDWDGRADSLDLTAIRLIETRVLVRQADGWDALPYVWDGDDARRALTGAVIPVALRESASTDAVTRFPYVVPGRSECAGCHATDHTARAAGHPGAHPLKPIGLAARHLNRSGLPPQTENQLQHWAATGQLQGVPAFQSNNDPPLPANADWQDARAALSARARAYLDINCGHCHSRTGPARTSGLWLDAENSDLRHLGFCKPPIAAGRGSGGHTYSIVPGQPEASILVFRMTTQDPAARMPETGRSLMHAEGVKLISDWVAAQPGSCATST